MFGRLTHAKGLREPEIIYLPLDILHTHYLKEGTHTENVNVVGDVGNVLLIPHISHTSR